MRAKGSTKNVERRRSENDRWTTEGLIKKSSPMKVNDTISLSSAATSHASRTQDTERTSSANRLQSGSSTEASSSDDVHLSELVRSLRSLAAESPERQNKMEQLARAYATGSYKVDSNATASAMIDDAMKG